MCRCSWSAGAVWPSRDPVRRTGGQSESAELDRKKLEGLLKPAARPLLRRPPAEPRVCRAALLTLTRRETDSCCAGTTAVDEGPSPPRSPHGYTTPSLVPPLPWWCRAASELSASTGHSSFMVKASDKGDCSLGHCVCGRGEGGSFKLLVFKISMF